MATSVTVPDFRPAYRALFARLEADLGDVVRSFTRKNLPASAFAPDAQPALVLVARGDEPFPDAEQPYAYDLHATLVLHTRSSADDEAPDEALLELRKRIESALAQRGDEPQSEGGYWTSLGGAVRLARLDSVDIEDDMRNVNQVSTIFQVTMRVE